MLTLIKWIIVLLFAGFGLLIMMWAFQNAWLSATPVTDPEIYKTRAILLFPTSIIILALSMILYFVWPK